jgi:methylmalonyl-CoA mutase N-terminal domain/subunit
MERTSESGLPIDPVYDDSKLTDFRPEEKLGKPGEYPFTRGVYPRMYVDRPWTMRQYAGFATAKESNRRYHELIEAGTTGLSVAFDLPTQMGYDSDAPIAHGEVGKVGVAIDCVDDMRALFQEIPLSTVSTSMTINAPAAVLLLMYQAVGEEQGVPPENLTGTIQNDVLKEYIARGTYIYPPRPSLRLVADTFAYCRTELPKWNTISISGYHMAEAGATPVQEIAFTLANAKEYVRAARRLWARIMREEFKSQDPRSQMLRFHTQTAGVQLTAQQPEVNLIRVSLQAVAAVLGGTQSLHTNSFDEALALPSAKAARLALRTQQVIAYESDLTATADPFAGSYAIESMTDDVESAAETLMGRIEDMGGAAAAIERGFQKTEIEGAAYQVAREIDGGERVIVGVNRFTADGEEPYQPLRVDPSIEAGQAERLARLRGQRDSAAFARAISELKSAAEGTDNVLYPLRDALRADATLGEVCDALRDVWGEYRPREL